MDNIQIDITENGTTTLATAGKYCARNIDVNVEVPSGDNHYDAFWDSFQEKGGRTTYYYGFSGAGWNKDTFKPKHQIRTINSAEGIFRNFDCLDEVDENMVDLRNLKDSKGTPVINWTGCTNLKFAFYNARIEDTGAIDASLCTSSGRVLESTFARSATSKSKIKKIELKVSADTRYTTPFALQEELTDLIFTDGSVIGNSGIDLSASTKLSKASVESIINALSTTASGKSITLPIEAKTNNFTDAEWTALVAEKNWTISLA